MRKQLVIIGIALVFLGCNDNKPTIVKNSPSPISSSVITYTSPNVIPSNTPVPNENKAVCTVTSMYDFSKLVEYNRDGYVYNNYDTKASIYGFVYDSKGNPIKNAKISAIPFIYYDDINQLQDHGITYDELLKIIKGIKTFDTVKIEKCNLFKFDLTTKTDEKGFYSFKVGNYIFEYNIKVLKEGFTTREETTHVRDYPIYTNFGNSNLAQTSYANDLAEYLQYMAIQDEPEINNITINSTPLDKISRSASNIIIKKTETDSRMKVKESKTGYEMVLTFSEAVNKDTVHENLQILSLVDSKVILDNSNITLTWVDAMTIKANFSIDKKGKYNIFFKKPFEDLSGNKAISDRYFRTRSLQISENIIFEII